MTLRGKIALAGVCLSTLAAGSHAQTTPRTLTVIGEGEAQAVPDTVIFSLGIESMNTDIKLAKEYNDARMKAVMEVARAEGVREEDFKTDYFNIFPRYEGVSHDSKFLGYMVRKSLTVTLHDLTRFEDLLSRLLTVGAENPLALLYVQGIRFTGAVSASLRDQARRSALRDARHKADDLARQLGVKVGPVNSVYESSYTESYGYNLYWWGAPYGSGSYGGEQGGNPSVYAPGKITTKMSVNISYLIVSPSKSTSPKATFKRSKKRS